MKKWSMIIDVSKCHDCNNCFLACKDEHVGNEWPSYATAQPWHGQRWMNIMRRERGQYPLIDVAYLPTPCMHCNDAPCIRAAENNAVTKRDNGIVIINPETARGQRALVDACPYGAIWWNEEKALPQKCTLCAHLLESGWDKPRCVQACPTGALQVFFAEEGDMEALRKTEQLEVLRPERNTKPRVYYKNLYRYAKCFIGGNVVLHDTDECAEGASVVLSGASLKTNKTALTNNYGDFKIDGLDEESGAYTVSISYAGYEPKTLEVDLKKSLNIGTIFVTPSRR